MPPTDPNERPSILDRTPDELAALASTLPPDSIPDAPDLPPDAPAPTVKGLDPEELANVIVASLPDDELLALPEVQAAIADPNIVVNEDVRADLEAAALGAMTEAEREDAARAQAAAENAAADTPDPEPAQNAP